MWRVDCRMDAAKSKLTARISACRNSCHDTDVAGCGSCGD